MRNIVLTVVLFFISGCSLNQLFLSQEIDTVNVVKYQTYLKQHRAYFTRTNLKFITKNDKYLFLYHAKKHQLGLLLYRQDTYTLYNFTNPQSPNITFTTKKEISYKHLLRHFSRLGYKSADLTNLGYSIHVALRRYKGVKTLMVETKDYHKLKQIYEKAIRNYQSEDILSIKTELPKKFIYPYFEKYKDQAKTPEQLAQLQSISEKLHFSDEAITIDEEALEENLYDSQHDTTKGYDYYLHTAPINELEIYLVKSDTRDSLSSSQYHALKTHFAKMKEQELLDKGSLEELIAAYKINKNPKYKKRIMFLIKETQKNQ